MLIPDFSKTKADKWLFVLPILLSLFGLLAIFDASSVTAFKDFGDKFYYFKHQAVWLAMGTALFFIFAIIDYKVLKKFSLLIFLTNLFLLVLVLFPKFGRQIYGGRRWIDLGGFSFQPAEFIKLSLIIYLSSLLEKRKNLLVFLTLVGIILTLLILEPDLGTAVIVAVTAFSVYFVSGCSLKQILGIFFFGLLIGFGLVVGSPYRKNRLLTYLNPSLDTKGISYHVRQILIALGSGKFFGRGLGQSRQKYLFLPEVTTDSIFAVIAEELGFLGSLILIFVFVLLIYRGIESALVVKDKFGQMLCTGIIFCIGLQTVVNLGAMVALIPLTGIPLPFISYGGSSLITCLAGMGIVYNISKNNNIRN